MEFLLLSVACPSTTANTCERFAVNHQHMLMRGGMDTAGFRKLVFQ